VPHNDARFEVVDERRQPRRHGVVAGRVLVAAPVEPDAPSVPCGHLADAFPAAGAQGSGFQVEEYQRGSAEGAACPSAHRLSEGRSFNRLIEESTQQDRPGIDGSGPSRCVRDYLLSRHAANGRKIPQEDAANGREQLKSRC
jgi:hypothetical protein